MSRNKWAEMPVPRMEKTNPMRILDRAGVEYEVLDYTASGAVSGPDVAAALGEDPAEAFKTLVTRGKSDRLYVFVLPVSKELDLKKAAASVGEKSVEMIKSKELLPTTGYVHGGCSPLGMRRPLRTVVDSSVSSLDRMYFSAGKIGLQVRMDPKDLPKVLDFAVADLCRRRRGSVVLLDDPDLHSAAFEVGLGNILQHAVSEVAVHLDHG